MTRSRSTSRGAEAGFDDVPVEPAPGKRSLTEQLAVQRKPAASPAVAAAFATIAPEGIDPFGLHLDAPPVQRAGADGAGPAELVHQAAALGTSGAGGSLPFLDQIQASFGHHDVRGVQAHRDGPAAAGAQAMGAEAFATGNHVAFAGSPTLHTAAHEAAHVVQQRAGVQLKRGVGAVGDTHEQHADAVADRVVQGRSATDLLDHYAPAAAPPHAGAIQRAIKLGEDELSADEAFARISNLLSFRTMDRSQMRHVEQVLTRFDFRNQRFANPLDLAQAVQAEIEDDYNQSEEGGAAPQHVVGEEIGSVMLLTEFEKMAKKYDMPGDVQQDVAAVIAKDADRLAALYETVDDLVTQKRKPEQIMKWFTDQIMEFAVNVIKEAIQVVGRPNAPFAIMTAGSGARQEMFPGSDIDLSIVTDTKDHKDVEGLFHFMQYVEKRISATVQALQKRMGVTTEIGLQPDTGVFGFAKTPEELAKKTLQMQNTGGDARTLASSKGGGDLAPRFLNERDKQATPEHALSELLERIHEFPVSGEIGGDHIDIKKGFLRFPTLALRELAQFFKLKSSSSFDRVRELIEKGVLDGGLGASLIEALNTISGIRLQMHTFYREENDQAAVKPEVAGDGEYVLKTDELSGLMEANLTLARFYQLLVAFAKTGGKSGLKEKSKGGLLSSWF